MLQVCSCIGGALILFAALMLWTNSGRVKSENETELP